MRSFYFLAQHKALVASTAFAVQFACRAQFPHNASDGGAGGADGSSQLGMSQAHIYQCPLRVWHAKLLRQ